MAELVTNDAEFGNQSSIETQDLVLGEGNDSCSSCMGLSENKRPNENNVSCSDLKSAHDRCWCYGDTDSWSSGSNELVLDRSSCSGVEVTPASNRVEQVVSSKLFVLENDDDDSELDWPSPPPSAQLLVEEEHHISLHQSKRGMPENVDALLQRIVRERSSELNQLQNAARPVTGSNARENLSEFFNRNLQPESSINNRERTLPEDVENLVQRSIVTSTLRRHAFRSTLEQALASRLNVSTNQVPTRSAQFSRSAQSGTSTPQSTASFRNNVIPSDSASIASDDISDAASDIEQLQIAVNVGVQMLSETIEEDLTQLHHLRVVSSALNADFRNDLERLVQQRAATVGGGELVQRFIRTLPSASRPTPPVPPQRAARNAQHAASRPMSMSTQLNLSAELSAMKLQMEEMKRMMQMNFEVQMDTQRAIRQEVAAVFGAFMQQMASQGSTLPSHQTSAPSFNPSTIQAGSCLICLENQVDTLLYQCGHICVCNPCGIQLKTQGHKCPLCRAPIRDVVRAYKAQ